MAKAAGFHGIEPRLSADGEIHLETPRDELKRLRDYAEQTVAIHSLMGGVVVRETPLTTSDKDQVQRGAENIGKALKVAQALGATCLLVVPGAVTEQVRYDVAWEGTLEGLKLVAPVAADLKVVVGIENVWNKFLLSPLEMRTLLDEVNSPWVRCYFDVGNFLPWAFPQHWIEILGKRIAKVHVKDFRLNVGNINGFVTLFQGDVDWKAVRQALRTIGYADYLTAEIALNKQFPQKSLQDIATSLDVIISS
jgi:L-ribulose-5-phosphate 3-epimerase